MQSEIPLARAPWNVKQEMILLWLEPLFVFLVTLLPLLVGRRLLFRWLRRKVADSEKFPANLLETVRWPSVVWCLVASLAFSSGFAPLTRSQQEPVSLWLTVALILSFALAGASFLARMIAYVGERRGVAIAGAGLTQSLVQVLVFCIGAMILLRYLGITITPILTALGVTGFAVALAMRDELANLFAGIHILVENPYSVGDYIYLSTGEEGTVMDIGWRTTRLLTGTHNVLVIPNSKLTTTVLTNFSVPTRETAVEITVLAGKDADPRQVMRIAMEEAGAMEQVLPHPAPVARFDPGLTPTHLQFKLVVRVADRNQQGIVQSELRLRLLERFRREDVPLPVTPGLLEQYMKQ